VDVILFEPDAVLEGFFPDDVPCVQTNQAIGETFRLLDPGDDELSAHALFEKTTGLELFVILDIRRNASDDYRVSHFHSGIMRRSVKWR